MKSVTIYTGPLCNYCDAAKKLLVRNNIKFDEIERYFSQKDRNHKNNLRKKVATHEATHPGAPPRAMSLVDKQNIKEPYVFLRGNFGARGDRVPRRFPVALSPSGEERS